MPWLSLVTLSGGGRFITFICIYVCMYMADSRLSWQEQGHSHTHHKIRGTSSAHFYGGLFQHMPAGNWPETDPVEHRCGPGPAKYVDNTSQTQNPNSDHRRMVSQAESPRAVHSESCGFVWEGYHFLRKSVVLRRRNHVSRRTSSLPHGVA